ncbi:hypothetical protein ACLMPM_03560 [Yersinia enterocolitica]|uniref:hypothetical protein n=1 Tax=Yersinia enterocolitica TaxID=630 RepID=UPI00398CA6B7
MTNFIASISFLAACVGAWYAYKAYQSSKEVSFPKSNAHEKYVEIKHLSKEAKEFQAFLYKNEDRLVYLNIIFDSNEFEFSDDSINGEKTVCLNIWVQKTEKDEEEKEPLSVMNADGLNISIIIDDRSNAKVCGVRGINIIKGYFYIDGFGGPNQGYMGAIVRAAIRE